MRTQDATPACVVRVSYKLVTYQIYDQKFKFYAVSLKIRVKRPIMTFDGKNHD